MLSVRKNCNRFDQCYNFKQNDELGRGNSSIVYEGVSLLSPKSVMGSDAEHDHNHLQTRGTSNKYAIKCLFKPNLGQNQACVINDEVAILQQLHHPNIIHLYDFFDEEDFYYLVMEKVAGGELFDRIVAKECYNEKEARNVCRIMFDALNFMHKQGIAHRDLKPENLLLVDKGNDIVIKIGDFGFAKYTDDSHNDGRGSLTSQCGTPTYVSPEIIQRHHYGTKTDMWSVGIILYILLGGYPPFVEDDQRALFRKICISDFEFHQEFFSRVSDGAKTLISSLLTVDPRRRLSAQEALDSDWILTEDDILENNDLTGINLERLRLFNAKRKVRAAVLSLLAVNKFLVNGDLMLKQLAIV